MYRRLPIRCLLLFAAASVGCENEVRFAPDGLLRATSGLSAEQAASIDAAMAGAFGTPDAPRLPTEPPTVGEPLGRLFDTAALEQAAGPVESHTPGVTHGLYRRHCARCHGVTGDGRGPTALYQDPYPRDFRRGVFKWKSTYRDAPPTDADLQAVLERGVPGTAMPSFALLTIDERDALRQYVQYLAIRGVAELELVRFVAEELPPDTAFDPEDVAMRDEWLGRVAPTAEAWVDSAEAVMNPTFEAEATTTDGAELRLAQGRELYHSESAGCAKCHGPEGRGGATPGVDYEIDYDLWTRDRVEAARSSDSETAAVRDALEKQLPARPSRPRGLVGEAWRGGDDTLDRFRRLHQGIAGTTMPALGPRRPGEAGTLSDDEIGLIAEYVASRAAANSVSEPDPAVTPDKPGEASR